MRTRSMFSVAGALLAAACLVAVPAASPALAVPAGFTDTLVGSATFVRADGGQGAARWRPARAGEGGHVPASRGQRFGQSRREHRRRLVHG